MYQLNRKLWISIYVVAFAVMVFLSWSFGTGWAWGTWACAFGLFIVLTDPSPRLYEGDPRHDRYVRCDCPRCPGGDGAVNGEGEVDGW